MTDPLLAPLSLAELQFALRRLRRWRDAGLLGQPRADDRIAAVQTEIYHREPPAARIRPYTNRRHPS